MQLNLWNDISYSNKFTLQAVFVYIFKMHIAVTIHIYIYIDIYIYIYVCVCVCIITKILAQRLAFHIILMF